MQYRVQRLKAVERGIKVSTDTDSTSVIETVCRFIFYYYLALNDELLVGFSAKSFLAM